MPSNAPVFMMTVIPAKLLSIKKLSGSILAAQNENKKQLIRYLNMTIATWQGDRPTMDAQIAFAGGGIIITGGPVDDGSQGMKKWHWLNSGTSIRYATMTRGFKAKTRTGRVTAGIGAGGLAFVDRKVPRPGIKARRWYYYIPRLARKNFLKNIDNAISKGLQK